MNVVLWIASETEAEIAKSFNEAASRLDLPGYLETNTPDQNRFAVLQWLQKSSRKCLLTAMTITVLCLTLVRCPMAAHPG